MTIANGYTTLAAVAASSHFDDSIDDPKLERAIETASRQIDGWCKRRFYVDTDVSARVYLPFDCYTLYTDDIATSTGLIVKYDNGDDGTYETTISASNYQLYPLNGVVAGIEGWPYTQIELVEGDRFPSWSKRPSVQITAKWGWAAVPKAIEQATVIQAQRIYKGLDAPFGIIETPDGIGARMPAMHAEVRQLIWPYMKHAVLVG